MPKQNPLFPEDSIEIDEWNVKQAEHIESVRDTNRRDSYSNNSRRVLIAFLIAAIAYQALQLGLYYYDLGRENRIHQEVQAFMSPLVKPSETASSQETETEAIEPEKDNETETGTETETPAVLAEPVMLPEIAALREKYNNDDIVGYISIEGTNIEYAIVQAEDNDYYLNRDITGARSSAGSIFMDSDNNADVSDFNTILYGHNMKNGSMFHNMRYYAEESYFKEHSLINLKTLYEDTIWEIFSFYSTDTSFNYIQTRFVNEAEFLTLLEKITDKSFYDTGVKTAPGDRILTLSTCTNTSDIMRYVIHARLVTIE